MRVLECIDSTISCGIYEVSGFDCLQTEEKHKKVLEDLRDFRLSFNRLDRDDDDEDWDNYAPDCCMFLAALADFQWDMWDPILRKNGWTCVTRKGTEPINPNSGNKNRLYVLKRPAPPKPKKAKEEPKKGLLPIFPVVNNGNFFAQSFPVYTDDESK